MLCVCYLILRGEGRRVCRQEKQDKRKNRSCEVFLRTRQRSAELSFSFRVTESPFLHFRHEVHTQADRLPPPPSPQCICGCRKLGLKRSGLCPHWCAFMTTTVSTIFASIAQTPGCARSDEVADPVSSFVHSGLVPAWPAGEAISGWDKKRLSVYDHFVKLFRQSFVWFLRILSENNTFCQTKNLR